MFQYSTRVGIFGEGPKVNQSEAKKECFPASDWLKLSTLPVLYNSKQTKKIQVKEDKKGLSGDPSETKKKGNRLSVLYNSMRGSKRRELKEPHKTGG